MEVGNIKSWKRVGNPFPKSGQGETQKVTRIGDADDAMYVLKTMPPGLARGGLVTTNLLPLLFVP